MDILQTPRGAGSRISQQLVLVAAISALGLIAGLVAVIIPYWMLLATLFLPAFLMLTWVRPELGIVSVMGLLCGIAPSWLVPQVPFAGGQLQASELAFFGLLIVIGVKAAFNSNYWMSGLKIYIWPIGLLLVLALISSVNALIFFDNKVKDILYEARIFVYWLMIPIIAAVVNSRQILNRFLSALLLLGLILATMVCIQSFTGITLFSTAGAAGQLSTANKIYNDVTRSSLGQGVYVILFGLFLLLARYLLAIANAVVAVPLALIFTAGILATFGRGVWVASIVGVLLVGQLIDRKHIIKILLGCVVFIFISAAALSISRPKMADALLDRVMSFDANTSAQDESIVWRQEEREYAYNKIMQYPIFGIGLGGQYQPIRNRQMKLEQTLYIHNSYLYLALKLGIFSIIIPFWVCWLLYNNGCRLLHDIENKSDRAAVASLVAAFMLPNITSFTQPEWMDHPGVAFMGMMIGLIGAINNIYRPEFQKNTKLF